MSDTFENIFRLETTFILNICVFCFYVKIDETNKRCDKKTHYLQKNVKQYDMTKTTINKINKTLTITENTNTKNNTKHFFLIVH